MSYDFANKRVLITGGSMGIGAAFAEELARRGSAVVLVARSRSKMEEVAKRCGGAEIIAADMTEPGAVAKIAEHAGEIDVLINNAGFATHGNFASTPLDEVHDEVTLNVTALVELTHTLLPAIERRQGGIINVASTAAFQPVAYMAVYSATKAFVLTFSEALWSEYRDRGVRVLALCPGATDTPFFARAGEAAAVGKKVSPESLVQFGLRAFDKNKSYAIHGAQNYVTAMSTRFTTRAFVAKLTGRMMKPKLSDDRQGRAAALPGLPGAPT
jgi:uncharacterized protein